MTFESYVVFEGRKLRRGITTGTCAALAAKAATWMLLAGKKPEKVVLFTPTEIEVEVPLENAELLVGPDGYEALAAVVKDAGDDYDVTDGIVIQARAKRVDGSAVIVEGGQGIGRVTQPGLEQEIGEAAINKEPRKQIIAAVEQACDECGYSGGISVTIEVPEGEEVAKKTFNPQLGIEGGISILGTTGIVEPRSLDAIKEALEVEVHALAAQGDTRLIITLGSKGEELITNFKLPDDIPHICCANFVAYTVTLAVKEGFKEILLIGHVGKLIKVAGGVQDTHSRGGDCRAQMMAMYAVKHRAGRDVVKQIYDMPTTDACLDLLDGPGVRNPVFSSIAADVQKNLEKWAEDAWESSDLFNEEDEEGQPFIGSIVFTNRAGVAAMTGKSKVLISKWREQQ